MFQVVVFFFFIEKKFQEIKLPDVEVEALDNDLYREVEFRDVSVYILFYSLEWCSYVYTSEKRKKKILLCLRKGLPVLSLVYLVAFVTFLIYPRGLYLFIMIRLNLTPTMVQMKLFSLYLLMENTKLPLKIPWPVEQERLITSVRCSIMQGYTVDRGLKKCVKMTLSASSVIAKPAMKCTLPTTHGHKGLLIDYLGHCCWRCQFLALAASMSIVFEQHWTWYLCPYHTNTSRGKPLLINLLRYDRSLAASEHRPSAAHVCWELFTKVYVCDPAWHLL